MATPTVTVSMNPEVIYIGESATLSWNVTGAIEVGRGVSIHHMGLIASGTSVSGTALDGGSWGGGGAPFGASGFLGSETIDNKNPLIYKPSWQTWGFFAQDSFGNSAGSTVRLNIIPEPKFTGSVTPQRKDTIKSAIRDVTKKIMAGGIYWDTSLDTTVDAFKKKLISRTALWYNIRNELFNMNLITFKFVENEDPKKHFAGRWGDYSNEIELEFSSLYNPYYEFVILHELIHKCGFNGELQYKGLYSKTELEDQNYLIGCSVYSTAGACSP